MANIVIRLVVALVASGWGLALFVASGNQSYAPRDPALKYYRVILIPEILYAAFEAFCLFLELAFGPNPLPSSMSAGLLHRSAIASAIYLSFGFSYAFYCKKILEVSGITLTVPIPLAALALLTAANYAVFALQFPFPGFAPSVRVLNKALLALQLLWAGLSAVVGRGIKDTHYPSMMGGFGVAIFCLAYLPFPSIAEVTSLRIPGLDPYRPISLQLHPFRELVTLSILTAFYWPIYASFRRSTDVPAEPLSGREAEVEALLARGLSNRDIAETLNISVATVKTHVRNVLRKKGASSRGEIVREAFRAKAVQ